MIACRNGVLRNDGKVAAGAAIAFRVQVVGAGACGAMRELGSALDALVVVNGVTIIALGADGSRSAGQAVGIASRANAIRANEESWIAARAFQIGAAFLILAISARSGAFVVGCFDESALATRASVSVGLSGAIED